MIKLRPLVSLVAGIALVAGVTAAGAAPAQATNQVLPSTGTTAITFDEGILDALDGVGVNVSVKAPASFNTSRGAARFPVTGIVVKNDAILHSGALVFSRGSVEDGIVVLGQPTIRDNEGHLFVTAKVVLGETKAGRLEVLRVTNLRTRVDGDRVIVEGVVRLTGNPAVVDAINQNLGLDDVFVPSMRLGTVRASILPGAVT